MPKSSVFAAANACAPGADAVRAGVGAELARRWNLHRPRCVAGRIERITHTRHRIMDHDRAVVPARRRRESAHRCERPVHARASLAIARNRCRGGALNMIAIRQRLGELRHRLRRIRRALHHFIGDAELGVQHGKVARAAAPMPSRPLRKQTTRRQTAATESESINCEP